MSRAFPDVNVLFALLWPRHNSHISAQKWFATAGYRGWATSPLTQLGVLRLLTNPLITQNSVDARSAAEVLQGAMKHSGHEFWPIEASYPEGLQSVIPQIQGHRQWPDAALLCHAVARKGTLITFDAGIAKLASRELAKHVLLLRD